MATEMYDRAVTVFSPDGRLVQVEYSREAVKRGTTVVGIKAEKEVVLLADKRLTSRFIEPGSVKKIFRLDEHIGAATSGLVADAIMLIDRGREEAQINKVVYDESINVETLAKKICNYMQAFTQYGGLRPFGTSLLIAGVDNGEKYLFSTDPSGAKLGYKVVAIGSGESIATKVFEEKYTEDLNLEDAILLGLEALYKVTEGKMSSDSIDIGVVDTETEKFRLLDSEEIEAYIKKIGESQKEEK